MIYGKIYIPAKVVKGKNESKVEFCLDTHENVRVYKTLDNAIKYLPKDAKILVEYSISKIIIDDKILKGEDV